MSADLKRLRERLNSESVRMTGAEARAEMFALAALELQQEQNEQLKRIADALAPEEERR